MKQEREEKKRKKKNEETQPRGQKSGNPPKGQGQEDTDQIPRPMDDDEEDAITDERKRA